MQYFVEKQILNISVFSATPHKVLLVGMVIVSLLKKDVMNSKTVRMKVMNLHVVSSLWTKILTERNLFQGILDQLQGRWLEWDLMSLMWLGSDGMLTHK